MPTRALNRGEIIKASDFTIERRPRGEFTNDQPVLTGEIVGLAPRRAVRAGQPLRQADLMKPEIVQKNDMVMLQYEVPGIVLSMRGKALENGAEGDMVSVLNVESKRTVQGVVSGPGRITILAPKSTRVVAAAAAIPAAETE